MAREPRRGQGRAYEVGYGKPPERTRFRPGQSGNPAGRPKGALDLDALLGKALAEKVSVKDGSGRRRRISKGEAAVTQLVNKAAGGTDPRATRLLFELVAKRQARESYAPGAGPGQGTPPAAAARLEASVDWSSMTTAELSVVEEACRIIEDRQREPRPMDHPMPPRGPGGREPDAANPPLRWCTPDPADPPDAGEEGG